MGLHPQVLSYRSGRGAALALVSGALLVLASSQGPIPNREWWQLLTAAAGLGMILLGFSDFLVDRSPRAVVALRGTAVAVFLLVGVWLLSKVVFIAYGFLL